MASLKEVKRPDGKHFDVAAWTSLVSMISRWPCGMSALEIYAFDLRPRQIMHGVGVFCPALTPGDQYLFRFSLYRQSRAYAGCGSYGLYW